MAKCNQDVGDDEYSQLNCELDLGHSGPHRAQHDSWFVTHCIGDDSRLSGYRTERGPSVRLTATWEEIDG